MYRCKGLMDFLTKSKFNPTFNRLNSSTTVESKMDDKLYKMVILETRGHDPAVLRSYDSFLNETAKELDIKIGQSLVPKKLMERFSLLKSAFVHKKHFAQYEIRTHFRILEIQYVTGSTADTFLEYVERNLPEGVAMKVTKHSIERLPEYVKRLNK